MAFDNIANALKRPGEGLTPQQQQDNYKAFSDLMSKGVYLPDVLTEVKSLKERVEALERPKDNPLDAEIFAVMEASVKGDPEVVKAKAKLADAKTRVISELCMRDEGYRRAFDEYRTIVHAKYVGIRQEVQATGGKGIAGSRADPKGGVSDKAGVQGE
jgi:hypothetical protein